VVVELVHTVVADITVITPGRLENIAGRTELEFKQHRRVCTLRIPVKYSVLRLSRLYVLCWNGFSAR
jgi:hypothetical protein